MGLTKRIVGPSGQFTLEQRILHIWNLIVSLICILNIILNFIVIDHAWLANTPLILGVVAFITSFWVSRFKSKFQLANLLFVAAAVMVFSLSWFSFQGIKGSMPLYFLSLFFVLIIISGKYVRWTIVATLAHLCILVALQYSFPDWVTPYASEEEHFFDIFGSTVILIIVNGLFLTALKVNYDKQRAEVESKNKELEESQEKISSSIKYASLIQNAVIPDETSFENFTEDYFVMNLPRDIVSGDFYWAKTVEINNRNYHLVVVGDCTGHGVPGALMSMLGISSLTEIVNEKNIQHPEIILNSLRIRIKSLLKVEQSIKDYKRNDSIDLALVVMDPFSNKLYYSGANRPLVIIKNNEEMLEIKPDRQPIGIYQREKPFTLKEIDIDPLDQFYFFTDGITDQFDETGQNKLMKSNFKKFLLKHAYLGMGEQGNKLEEMFYDYKGNGVQMDDILVIGIKPKLNQSAKEKVPVYEGVRGREE